MIRSRHGSSVRLAGYVKNLPDGLVEISVQGNEAKINHFPDRIKTLISIVRDIKSRVDKVDVAELHKIAKLYEKAEGVKLRPVIIGAFIDGEAHQSAKFPKHRDQIHSHE